MLEPHALAPLVEGALEIRRLPDAIQPIRLPDHVLDFSHPSLRDPLTAEATAGVRLRFTTASRQIILSVRHVIPTRYLEGWAVEDEPVVSYDVIVDGQLHDRILVEGHEGGPIEVVFARLPSGDKLVEIWLPHGVGVHLLGMTLDPGHAAAQSEDDRPRWVVYGSSITHATTAAGPTETWPAVSAAQLGWHLTSLGFRGGCHLDPFVARAIADRRADFLTVKLGINVHTGQSMRERTFRPAVHGFLQTIRDGHPETPLVVVSPIFGVSREDSAITVLPAMRRQDVPKSAEGDLTLSDQRDILQSAVELRRHNGDEGITYLDGLRLLGADDRVHLTDGLHPDADGQQLIGARFARAVAKIST